MSKSYVNCGKYIAIICALLPLACGLSTPTPTPEPTATWTPEPTNTPAPTATVTPAPVLLPPFCIVPPIQPEAEALIREEYPDAVVPDSGALLFAVRFPAEGEEYVAMLGYKDGVWELIYIIPWGGGFEPTPTPTPGRTWPEGEAMR